MEQDELLEGFQTIRRFVREIECFDVKMFREMDGHGVYAQIKSLNSAVKKYNSALEARCLWQQDDDGNWDTACGDTFTMLDETSPKGNSMDYCPYCGCRLIEEFYKDPFEDGENE